jgi:predicted transcriptional regulator
MTLDNIPESSNSTDSSSSTSSTKHTNMTLEEIIKQLDLTVLTAKQDFSEVLPTSGYTSDLLSCVMAGAGRHGIWITLQAHTNIVAVAALLDLSAIIITEGAMPDTATIQKANQEKIVLLSTPKQSFQVGGMLWELGIRSE